MRKRHHSRLWGVLLLLSAFGFALLLTLRALEENIIFFYSPGELSAAIEKPIESFRLGGLVMTGSHQRFLNDAETVHHFRLGDGDSEIAVIYQGILPDLFREGQGMIATGIWNAAEMRFVARELLTKHDENYMPKEIVETLKKNGKWRQ